MRPAIVRAMDPELPTCLLTATLVLTIFGLYWVALATGAATFVSIYVIMRLNKAKGTG